VSVNEGETPYGVGKGETMEIDITGSDGNVFYLMGQAKKLAKLLDLDPKPIVADMRSGDYEHALDVFEEHFGDYCQLTGR